MDRIWGEDYYGDSNVLEVFVASLRRALEAGGEPRLIQTGRGVRLVLRRAGEDGAAPPPLPARLDPVPADGLVRTAAGAGPGGAGVLAAGAGAGTPPRRHRRPIAQDRPRHRRPDRKQPEHVERGPATDPTDPGGHLARPARLHRPRPLGPDRV